VKKFATFNEENEFIVDYLDKLIKSGGDPREVCIVA